MEALTPLMFQVLKLRFLDEMEDEEIAAILKISLVYVRVLRKRGLKRLFDYFMEKGML